MGGAVFFGSVPNICSPVHTVVTAANATTRVVDANENRVYLLLVNDSDEAIYIKFGAAAALNEGIRLNASGGSFEMSPANANLYTGFINAISTSGNKKLLVTQG